GLAAAILNLIANWLKAKKGKKQAKAAQINALKQELLHALWLIEYNHNRIQSKELPYKALTTIGTTNVEQVLFGTTLLLSLEPEIQSRVHDYLQQTVYLNSLVAEYVAIMPTNPLMTSRWSALLGEIKAICTSNDTYRENDPEPSLRVRVRKLLDDLSELRL
ncbi:MAG: hypothetical protein MUO30_09095, partial [Anaerolineales bacterium]|nr:hypothetical protein [Anaerolineales bacterium]